LAILKPSCAAPAGFCHWPISGDGSNLDKQLF
jgi:hypothetical protein